MKDFYEILGVDKNATTDEIKKAFRKLAHEHHPDKNHGKNTETYTDIQEAYCVLSDPEDRAFYNENGFSGKAPKFEALINLSRDVISLLFQKGVKPEMLINEIERVAQLNIERMDKEGMVVNGEIDKLKAALDNLETKDKLNFDLMKISIRGIIETLTSKLADINKQLELYRLLLDYSGKYEKGVAPAVEIRLGSMFGGNTATSGGWNQP